MKIQKKLKKSEDLLMISKMYYIFSFIKIIFSINKRVIRDLKQYFIILESLFEVLKYFEALKRSQKYF